MRYILSLSKILLLNYVCQCQQFNTDEIYFTGYKGKEAIFTNETGHLFTLEEQEPNSLIFLDSGKLSFFPTKYVGAMEIQDNTIRYVLTFGVPFQIIIEKEGKLKRQEVFFSPERTVTDFKNNIVYLSQTSDDTDYYFTLPIKMMDINIGDITELPIKGVRPMLAGNYLFYADYSNPKQFDLVYDIYRVKIGDWDNPEKVFKKNYKNGWKVDPDGKYLVAEVISEGFKPRTVVYNIDQKKYAIVDLEQHKRPFFFSLQKAAICFYDHSINSVDEEKDRFIFYPIPKEFPYTPDWAMDFGESFINNYLLEEADEDTLRSLDKAQLRLLRNAIFARRGWRFNDRELSDFFKQFEWYNYQTNLYKNNSEIKLTNSDKWRIKLIQNIEDDK